jgi:hypothetical protein
MVQAGAVGPVVLVITMSGSSLAVTTGIAAGVILLGTAVAEDNHGQLVAFT